MITKKEGAFLVLRGLMLFFFIVLFSLFSFPVVSAAMCANPYVDSPNYCESDDVTQDFCCPAPADYYGEPGAPASQSDCIANYYDNDAACSVTGCCFLDTQQTCSDGALEGSCESDGGSWASSCSALAQCTAGCCVYDSGITEVAYITSFGYCSAASGTFYDSITIPAECSALIDDGGDSAPACRDGIDNDDDTLTDFPSDNGCSSADDSDESTDNACTDGVDNDNDDATDSIDSCCVGDSVSEELCDLAICTEGAITTDCQCGSGASIVECTAGNYCCGGVCQSTSCAEDDSCTPGDREYCGTTDDGLCIKYVTCLEDGTWGDSCVASDDCSAGKEVCDNLVDDNGDGNMDCEQPSCYNVKCGTSADHTACGEYGYDHYNDGIYECCSDPRYVNDCDLNGAPETCGPCECTEHPVDPEIESIAFTQGEASLTLTWDLGCTVNFIILRCNGAACADDLLAYTAIASVGDIRTYKDATVGANQRYCYVVEALYDTPTYSEPYCIEDSGDALCQQLSSEEFCLDAYGYLDEQLVTRAGCDEKNKLDIIESCTLEKGSDFYCVGPDALGGTQCVEQTDCDVCSDPLGIYGFWQTSIFETAFGSEYCSALDTCYFDYTSTLTDAFKECSQISSCYDYHSAFACNGQTNTYGNSNKCLRRNCDWIELDPSLGTGICQETMDEFKECTACDSTVFNSVYDACTTDKCVAYGESCYKSSVTLECSNAGQVGCTDYTSDTHCSGGTTPLTVDVVYSGANRISGTNDIITPSSDWLGIGLCRWSTTNGCFKDADGDKDADYYQLDFVPPTTTVLTPNKVSSLDITLLVSDTNPDGSSGTGVRATYYCLAEGGSSCYPTTLLPVTNGVGKVTLGNDGGSYTLYYYSEDIANNLEVVSAYDIEVDKTPPEIIITYDVTPDTTDPYDDSTITFEIIVSEDAYCTDQFEDSAANQLDSERNTRFITQYGSLTDGYYYYNLTCIDLLGNKGLGNVLARVDADLSIFDPRPAILNDDSVVKLEVSTLYDGSCAFEPNQEVDRFEEMTYAFDSEAMNTYFQHTYPNYRLSSNGMYFFDVKCYFPEQGRYGDDEIQFVFDNTPPHTTLVDTYGIPLDYASFYNGDAADIYLKCVDTPEGGFGCDHTLYCVDTVTCVPDLLSSPDQSLTYDLGEESRINVCYQSYEKTWENLDAQVIGGLVEPVTCTELKIDHYAPTLQVTNPTDRMVVYSPSLTVTGTVTDPDVTSDPEMSSVSNTVTITLTTPDGKTTEYANVPANNDFSSAVTLALPLSAESDDYNLINIYAVDRSGATSAVQTFRVLFSSDLPTDPITLVSPVNGVASTKEFELKVDTYLDGIVCAYSKNDASLSSSIPFTRVDDNTFTVRYTLDTAEAVPEYAYVKCQLENGVTYDATFMLMYDTTAPVITKLFVNNSDGKTPATIIEAPLKADVVVETDDYTRCKYGTSETQSYDTGMYKFEGYDDLIFSKMNRHTFTNLVDKTTYTYYFQCQNGASMLSTKQSLTFTVDLSKGSEITMLEPGTTSKTSVRMRVETTREATSCTYGTTEAGATSAMTKLSTKEWASNYFTLTSGKYTYYVKCSFVDGSKTASFPVIVDTTGPVISSIDDGNVTHSNTTLSAKWNVTEDLTSAVLYNVSVGTQPKYNDTVAWFTTTDLYSTLQRLKLKNQTKYYWNVRAKNSVDVWGEMKSSDGVFIDATSSGDKKDKSTVGNDTTIYGDHCTNGKQDTEETDIDCGGEDCNACPVGYACLLSTDCSSGMCGSDHICIAATCEDQIQNQGEADIDCGGNYCTPCLVGQACMYDRDCETKFCSSRTCTVPSCDDGIMNGEEEGIDCGGMCTTTCEVVAPQADPTCDDGRKNQGEEGIDCGGPCAEVCPEVGATAKSGFSIFTWILIVLMVVLLGVGGVYGYNEWYVPRYGGKKLDILALLGMKKKTPPPPLGLGAMRSGQPLSGPNAFGAKPGMPGAPGSMQRPGIVGLRPGMSSPMRPGLSAQSSDAKRFSEQKKKDERSSLFSKFDDPVSQSSSSSVAKVPLSVGTSGTPVSIEKTLSGKDAASVQKTTPPSSAPAKGVIPAKKPVVPLKGKALSNGSSQKAPQKPASSAALEELTKLKKDKSSSSSNSPKPSDPAKKKPTDALSDLSALAKKKKK